MGEFQVTHLRATVFFQLGVGILVGQLCATAISSALMKAHSPWLPICIGYLVGLASCSAAFLLPETLSSKISGTVATGIEDTSSCHTSGDGVAEDDFDAETTIVMHHTLLALWNTLLFAIHDRNILISLLTFLFNAISVSSINLLLQYISVRYAWTIAQAGFLMSLRAGVNIILFILVLPLMTRWLLLGRYHFSSMRKDLWLARGSNILLPTGFIVLALSPNVGSAVTGIIILTLGTGFPSLMRSLVTSMVDPHYIARLYGLITIFEMVGYMLSGPMLAVLFKHGLELGGFAVGLPFFAAGGIASFSALLVWTISITQDEDARIVESVVGASRVIPNT